MFEKCISRFSCEFRNWIFISIQTPLCQHLVKYPAPCKIVHNEQQLINKSLINSRELGNADVISCNNPFARTPPLSLVCLIEVWVVASGSCHAPSGGWERETSRETGTNHRTYTRTCRSSLLVRVELLEWWCAYVLAALRVVGVGEKGWKSGFSWESKMRSHPDIYPFHPYTPPFSSNMLEQINL
jgi:hypothetical protein